ncbi:MAG TPA: hypothetical protein VF884_13515 [Nitrososphaeraceae archaeon]
MEVVICAYCGVRIRGSETKDWFIYTNFRRYLKVIECPIDDPSLGMLPQQYVCGKCHEDMRKDRNESYRWMDFPDRI